MAENKKKGEEEKGFVIRDKRFSATKEGEPSQAKEGEKIEEPAKQDTSQETPLPEINFINFIFSLSTSALIQLGEIQDPITQKLAKNLPLAKQTVDLIGMLKEKTKGNLTSDEEKLLDSLLYDLRMRYVKAKA
ncbi:MAG: DUF1844 domain-containing protein [Thermodesulfobacteriota bacterium]